jgi:serine/threonine-protein kinase
MFEPGTPVGRYRVIGPLGRGGMGGVHEVENETGARFALKAPLKDLDGNAEVTRRFAREANALRMLEHPNVVGAVDMFVEGGLLVLVMEKATGPTLAARLTAGALPPRQALVLARQLLGGIGYAHALGLVHRDLKPDNVILVDMGGWDRVKVIDFGLVKLLGDAAAMFGGSALTKTGHVFGTPMYMSPEQALGRLVDGRADLYAVGVMLFEMLAGRPPFTADTVEQLMYQHVKSLPPALDEVMNHAPWVTHEVLQLVETALFKDPQRRFADAAAMTDALDRAFGSLDRVP